MLTENLTVACVKHGTKYSAHYVNVLKAMVEKHLSLEHQFVCFTEDPRGVQCECRRLPKGIKGWWNKLYLFKRGVVEGKLLFLDLDVAITGSLDDIARTPGFAIIRDWHLPCFNSSVFVKEEDQHAEVWDKLMPSVMYRLHGDQDWITERVPEAAVFPTEWCVSYRSQAVGGPPAGARVVCFHGEPKPAQLLHTWVGHHWRDDVSVSAGVAA